MKKEDLINRKYYVYALICPLDFDIKYIGRTSNIKKRKRLHYHVSSQNFDKNPELYSWINSLKTLKVKPEFRILLECNYDTSISVEKMLIKKIPNLFNKVGKL